jgi:hypothetical protein
LAMFSLFIILHFSYLYVPQMLQTMTRTLYNNHPSDDHIKNHSICLFKYT